MRFPEDRNNCFFVPKVLSLIKNESEDENKRLSLRDACVCLLVTWSRRATPDIFRLSFLPSPLSCLYLPIFGATWSPPSFSWFLAVPSYLLLQLAQNFQPCSHWFYSFLSRPQNYHQVNISTIEKIKGVDRKPSDFSCAPLIFLAMYGAINWEKYGGMFILEGEIADAALKSWNGYTSEYSRHSIPDDSRSITEEKGFNVQGAIHRLRVGEVVSSAIKNKFVEFSEWTLSTSQCHHRFHSREIYDQNYKNFPQFSHTAILTLAGTRDELGTER